MQHSTGMEVRIKKATPNVGKFEISNYRYVFDGGLNPKRPPT